MTDSPEQLRSKALIADALMWIVQRVTKFEREWLGRYNSVVTDAPPCQECAARLASHAAIEAAIEQRTEAEEYARLVAEEYRLADLEIPGDDCPF